MATRKAVAKKDDSEMIAGVNMEEYAGLGNEEAGAEDYAVPYISILQKLSPQCDPSEAEFIEGAIPGMLYDTVTHELTDGEEGMILIPCYFKKEWVEWVPREKSGGIVATHDFDSIDASNLARNDKGQVIYGDNILVDTRYHYVIAINPSTGEITQAILPMSSTQVKKSRRWNSLMSTKTVVINGKKIRPPTFAFMYKMTTVQEQNDKGKWFGYKIELIGQVEDKDTFEYAKNFYDLIKSGSVRAATDQDPAEEVL
jgi:hypothetical protein